MGFQKKILTEAVPYTGDEVEVTYNGSDSESGEGKAALSGEVGVLALGKVGDIWSRAYGPLVYAVVNNKDGLKFGEVLDGYGLLVNGNDMANENARFEAADGIKEGQTGSFLTSGAAVVLCSQVEAIKAKMNARVVYGKTEGAAEGDVCAIEVNGFLPPQSDMPLPIPEDDSEESA